MLNGMTEAEFQKNICNKVAPTTKWLHEFKHYHVFRCTALSTRDINKIFNITENNFAVLKCLSVNKLETYINEGLYYCPKCMEYGYHSMFHQLKFMENCFIHKNQALIKVDKKNYALFFSQRKPYKEIDVIPTIKDITLNRNFLLSEINNLHFELPDCIKVIDPNYKKYKFPKVSRMNESTNRLLFSIMFGGNTQIPVFEVPMQENDIEFEKLLKHYRSYYLSNFNLFRYQTGLFPSVYFAIYDYVQKILVDIPEKEIHKISFNLRYNQNILSEEGNKYISFLTASAFLCSVNDENFYRLKRVWSYDKNYENMAYYIDLSNLEEEILTHSPIRYHYIYTLLFQRIADLVYKQIQEQFYLTYENNPLWYEYDLKIPQYVVTLENDVFKVYECV
ncbi:hypothetical protein [Ruminiclostridium papyrosolvens]|uniref:Uncharacterized protein n=1 Tax=Ruminiclostridium papyrosolvens C7 TaxID=1330534 RepID=U4R0N0_9FIRM|nr:hypothetical protein [Ruminiclostridium papyrosolvens]EPR10217.1 hypothetical protein L323_14425 [Ruminiclostridium papyrosolvens C7]